MDGTVSRTLIAVRRSVRTALFARTVAMRNRRAIVSFTFDDFPSSAVSNGARLLEDHGARGTFYLTGSYCGRGRGILRVVPFRPILFSVWWTRRKIADQWRGVI
jgi:hypothetical protein